jgi:nitrogen regulatory protein PII
MENNYSQKEIELICFIVNFGLGSKVIKLAKQSGLSGGTVFLGKGTANSRILGLLALAETRKELVYLIAEKNLAYEAMEELSKKLELKKPNHGIAFSTGLAALFGITSCPSDSIKKNEGDGKTMYQAIYTIVEKGAADTVLDAAYAAGARGGTIINARGAGPHENKTLFSMAIEPEKEIVMILTECSLTEGIANSIKEALKMDEPGNGLMFILDINKTYGLY